MKKFIDNKLGITSKVISYSDEEENLTISDKEE